MRIRKSVPRAFSQEKVLVIDLEKNISYKTILCNKKLGDFCKEEQENKE